MSIENPRILMFSPFCFPPSSAESIVTAKLLIAFLDAGWEIDVIGQADSGQFYPYDVEGIWKPLSKIVNNIDVSAGFHFLEKAPDAIFKKVFSRTQSLLWVAKAVFAARRLSSQKKVRFHAFPCFTSIWAHACIDCLTGIKNTVDCKLE